MHMRVRAHTHHTYTHTTHANTHTRTEDRLDRITLTYMYTYNEMSANVLDDKNLASYHWTRPGVFHIKDYVDQC